MELNTGDLSNENWISNRLEEQKVKPKLGRKVYCIYETGIRLCWLCWKR